jgi:hypothetical protein
MEEEAAKKDGFIGVWDTAKDDLKLKEWMGIGWLHWGIRYADESAN